MESAKIALLADDSYQSLHPWWELLCGCLKKNSYQEITGGVFL